MYSPIDAQATPVKNAYIGLSGGINPSTMRALCARRRGALLGRSAVIRYHVLKNRYLTILRNDTVAGYVGNLPFVLGRDLALLGLVLVTSPAVLGRLWSERAVFRGAMEKRRLDAARGGHHFEGGESV